MCKVCDTGLPAYIVSFDLPEDEKPTPGHRSISFVTLTLDKNSADAMVEAYRRCGIKSSYRPVRLGPKELGMLGDLLAHATKWDTRDLVVPGKACDA